MLRLIAGAALAALVAAPATAAPLCAGADMGFAGLLANCNKGEELALTLSSGQPLAEGPITLESGAYYEMMITSDGSQELALEGPAFFRAIWIDEVVINDLEVRPLGLDSFEFDDAGTIEFSFIAIKPGSYEMKVPGNTGDMMSVAIQIK